MHSKQKGFATITLTVLLLSIIILVTLYTARFKVQEQRIMRNHASMQEASMVADAAIEQVIMEVDGDRSDLNRTIAGTIGGAQYSATLASTLFEETIRGDVEIVDIVLTANSADTRATRTMRQQIAVLPMIRSAPDTPVAIKGSMNVSGNFEVVANPNGGGDGVPLSIWTEGDVDINGSGTTCGQQEYTEGNCSSQPFSERGEHGVDILDNDPNFPDDLLEYLFGISEPKWQDLRDSATAIVNGCDSIGPASTGLIWVIGDCAPTVDIGSTANPVALVIQDGSLLINGSTEINGMVFAFRTPGSTLNHALKLNGGATINGAVMANFDPDLSNGTLLVRYHEEVLTNLVNNDAFKRVTRVGGSWRDF